MTKFFIQHPVIALVLNAMIIIVGLIGLSDISLREYPEVELPKFFVSTSYSNASAELVETAITNVLEDQLAGVEGVDVMTSESVAGSSRISLDFQQGVSADSAMIAIRDAIGLAERRLPSNVDTPRIRRADEGSGPSFMNIVVSAPHLNFAELTHYANLYVRDTFRSLKGVASVDVWGQPYTMKVTLDLKKMVALGVNADEVYHSIERSNKYLPVGNFRDQIPTAIDIKLSSIDDFESLFIKEIDGKPIFLHHLADIDLQSDDKRFKVHINGDPGLMLAISRTNDSNPLDVSRLVHEQLALLQQSTPEGVSISVIMDQANFIKASLGNIQTAIIEAIILVLLIVLLFLRNIRATLIPLVTIPISLIGAIIFMQALGISLNTLTLLAMVLAVGLVVDDAIVVLENITRHIEEGLPVREAAIKGSGQIAFAIVAMTLTLASVYAPIAFIQGATGQLFIEFAITLAGSVLISGVVALTLSPLMCASILKGHDHNFFPKLGVWLQKLDTAYENGLGRVLAFPKLIIFITLGLITATGLLWNYLPSETVPAEDRGLMGVYIPTIPGKNSEFIEEKVVGIQDLISDLPEAESYFLFIGQRFGGNIIYPLKPHHERERSPQDIVNELQPKLNDLPSMDAWAWSWDSGLPGMDDAVGGSNLVLTVSTVGSYRDLFDVLERTRQAVEQSGQFSTVRHELNLDSPGYVVNLDHNVMAALNITADQVSKIIEIFFSGERSLDFEKDSFRYQVTIEGNTQPWTLNELYITTSHGETVSLGTFAQLEPTAVPDSLFHHNQMRAGNLIVTMTDEQKIDTAMEQLWDITSEIIPAEFNKTWSGAAKIHLSSSNEMLFLFLMAIVFIYAILAIQFESFIDPFIIMFTVPFAIFGALFISWIFDISLNIYSQIGLITLVGLITKHGILIVEFANQLQRSGKPIREAVQQAAKLRLRPILMTTSAMTLGAIPLIFSLGAGAEARFAIGVVLVSGLVFGTLFTLFVLPKLYELIKLINVEKYSSLSSRNISK